MAKIPWNKDKDGRRSRLPIVVVTIEEIRMHIESRITDVSDVTASRIYEVMTGHLACNKNKEGEIRLIT